MCTYIGPYAPICVYWSIRVWDIPYAYGISRMHMGQYYVPYVCMGVPYEYACMIVHSYTSYMHSRHQFLSIN